MSLTDSPALPEQAIRLVNSTDKRGSDGTAGTDPKDSKIIPSQQVETASKRNGFIGTSGNVFFPDEKYQCPDGTSVCELSSGIYGCCHLVRGYVKFWQENSCFFGFGKIYLFIFYYIYSCCLLLKITRQRGNNFENKLLSTSFGSGRILVIFLSFLLLLLLLLLFVSCPVFSSFPDAEY